MMPNTVAKVNQLFTKLQNYGVARTQYRNNSSMRDGDVPLGDLELLVDNIGGIFYKGALGVVGFVLGGLTSTGVAQEVKEAKEAEEILIRMKGRNDERELRMERMRKRQEEWNRRHLSREMFTYRGKDTSN